ncbi:DDE-type integrase/transposase/recombinase, partial [Mesorhizobium sp. M0933]|uniref:DDE-type integrase/transposase/recombinase n=1 Tax=Mesorhizobium sp. M0933 TaxID=2957030 RepID=UPI0033372C15
MFKGHHFDQSVILLCVPWYLTYKLVHFWLQLLERFNRRKRTVTGKWHMDETYIKVHGKWMYLY